MGAEIKDLHVAAVVAHCCDLAIRKKGVSSVELRMLSWMAMLSHFFS